MSGGVGIECRSVGPGLNTHPPPHEGAGSRIQTTPAFRRSYANTLHLPDPTSPFIRTHLFPNPARAGRCTSGGRAGRLRAALEAVLRLVEVALDLVGGDLDVGCLVAHELLELLQL